MLAQLLRDFDQSIPDMRRSLLHPLCAEGRRLQILRQQLFCCAVCRGYSAAPSAFPPPSCSPLGSVLCILLQSYSAASTTLHHSELYRTPSFPKLRRWTCGGAGIGSCTTRLRRTSRPALKWHRPRLGGCSPVVVGHADLSVFCAPIPPISRKNFDAVLHAYTFLTSLRS